MKRRALVTRSKAKDRYVFTCIVDGRVVAPLGPKRVAVHLAREAAWNRQRVVVQRVDTTSGSIRTYTELKGWR